MINITNMMYKIAQNHTGPEHIFFYNFCYYKAIQIK